MDLTHASLHAAPIALILVLALFFAWGEAKRVSAQRLCGASGGAGHYLLAAALFALLLGGWRVRGLVPSPIEGGDGNREFLIAATRGDIS